MFIVITLHVLTAFILVGGLIGRNVVLWKAARASDVHVASMMADTAEMFERLMVIPGSFAVLIFGLFATWVQGLPPLGFLQGASTNWLLISLVLVISLTVLVPAVLVPRKKVFEASLHEAVAQGQITHALRQAFADKAVSTARLYELIAITAVIVLMVTRPF